MVIEKKCLQNYRIFFKYNLSFFWPSLYVQGRSNQYLTRLISDDEDDFTLLLVKRVAFFNQDGFDDGLVHDGQNGLPRVVETVRKFIQKIDMISASHLFILIMTSPELYK